MYTGAHTYDCNITSNFEDIRNTMKLHKCEMELKGGGATINSGNEG